MTAASLDLSNLVVTGEDGSRRAEFAVEGVTCAPCIGDIESSVADMRGLTRARLNYSNHRLAVEWNGDQFNPGEVIERLAARGYRAHPFAPRLAEALEDQQSKWLLRCLAVAGFAAMNVMLLAVSVWSGNVTDITPETRDFFHWLSGLIALPAAAYAGQPFFRSAIAAIRGGRLNMDVPISIGVCLALGMSVVETLNHAELVYFDSAVMLLFFLLCGRYLDHAMRRKTRAVASNLAALKAETANRLTPEGEQVLVPVSALAGGDIVVVLPGERVPADGEVLVGQTEIDESLITGETALRVIGPGERIYSGTINRTSVLRVLVKAANGKTLLDEIERLLETASTARSNYVKLADRAASLYAPVVHTAAALTLVFWLLTGASFHDAAITAIAVLIITCPCALALAIPTVQVVSSGALFKQGVFLNTSDALERLAEIDTVVFDKTGTLTLPDARVINAASVDQELLEIAARLALSSRHPMASAVAAEARARIPYDHVSEQSGLGVSAIVDGVEAKLGSPAFCGVEPPSSSRSITAFRYGAKTAIFEIAQVLRPDAIAVVGELKRLGLGVHILSGDRPEAVAPVAVALGVESWAASTHPAQKIARLEELKAAGRRVLMVGDGINDAPALAAAYVSLSPISAADLAQAHADAVFLGVKLAPVAGSVRTARKARALMKGNLWLAVVYNVFAVPLAFAGYVTPLVAAAAMSGSSILVTLNALRARAPAAAETEPAHDLSSLVPRSAEAP
ncbi:nitrogen fixation protein FixI [Terrihabitans soli]|uniref:Nitrogen fixation protein FixI n=1 Tax=Terrihabitans soli TaxID=708113 RepID=A0A6S6QZ20_9HYPH|nr:heavy metal translocating P-type ATPase [Terrihabitans soli]BCJ92281.1 nitrogen fixation protein FixI [Terrihabitans soli]